MGALMLLMVIVCGGFVAWHAGDQMWKDGEE